MPSASGRHVKEKARKKGRREMNGYGIETYADLAKTVGGMVLANEMGHRPLELVSGDNQSLLINLNLSPRPCRLPRYIQS